VLLAQVLLAQVFVFSLRLSLVSSPRVLDLMALHSGMPVGQADTLLNLERIELGMYCIQSMVSSLLALGNTAHYVPPLQDVQDVSLVGSGHSGWHEPDPPFLSRTIQGSSTAQLRRKRAKATRDRLWRAGQGACESAPILQCDVFTNTTEAGCLTQELVSQSKKCDEEPIPDHCGQKMYSKKDFEAAQAQMMEVAAQMCKQQVAEAMEPLLSQLSESRVKCAELEQKETKMKVFVESKLREIEHLKCAAQAGHPELHEDQSAILTELRERMDALCDMIDDIDHKVQTTLVDDVDWMQLRMGELEASVGIVCNRDGRNLPSSTSNKEENKPDDHPYDIQQLKDKMKVLAKRVSHVARILGIAESGEESEDADD